MKINKILLTPLVAAVCGLSSQAHAITWSSYGGHEYAFVQTANDFSWNSAQTAAQNHSSGGYLSYLVSITSENENAFVFGLIPSAYTGNGDNDSYQVWLGGHQAPDQSSKAGGWFWESGEQWAYTAWIEGEPNDRHSEFENGTENYLTMNRLGTCAWNDAPSYEPVVGYIVERQYVPDGGTSLVLLGASMVSLVAFRRKEA